MKIKINNQELNNLLKFQQGGEMNAPAEAAPAAAPEATNEDPMVQLIQAAAQALQAQDCNLAMQVLQALVQMAQGSAPAEAAPAEAPVYKMGGKLSRFIKK